MAQISKYPISSSVANRIFEVFIKTLTNLKNKNDADDFAYDLFSPTEKVMLSKRIAIAFLLLKGYQYREISRILRVSLSTIGYISTSIKNGKGAYERILSRIMNEEKLEEFFKEIAEKLLSVPAVGGKGSGPWRYLKEEIKKSRRQNKKEF